MGLLAAALWAPTAHAQSPAPGYERTKAPSRRTQYSLIAFISHKYPAGLGVGPTAETRTLSSSVFFKYYAPVLWGGTKLATALSIAAAALAVLVGGCGGGGEAAEAGGDGGYQPEASTTMAIARPPLTKAQFISRMNKICRDAWATVRDNWAQHISWQDEEMSSAERFADAVRASLLAGIDFHIFDNFRQLGAPAGEEEAIEAIIGPFQIAVELGWKERWRARSTADVAAQFDTYNERARAYGLDDCLVDKTHLRLKSIS